MRRCRRSSSEKNLSPTPLFRKDFISLTSRGKMWPPPLNVELPRGRLLETGVPFGSSVKAASNFWRSQTTWTWFGGVGRRSAGYAGS